VSKSVDTRAGEGSETIQESGSEINLDSGDTQGESSTSESESETDGAVIWYPTMALGAAKMTIDLEADDLPEQLDLFKYRHSKAMIINNITDPAKQAASFIAELPAEAVTLLMKYDWATAGKSESSIDDVIFVLCAAKKKKSSRIVARHRLFTRFMKKGEKFSDFKKALMSLADQCGYTKEVRESLLRDLIISRHSDEILQRHFLRELEDDVTLDKVIELCERNEDSKDAAREFHSKPSTSHQSNATSSSNEKKGKGKEKGKEKRSDNSGGKGDLWRCDRFCGGYHVRGSRNCKAFGTTCTKCGKANHFEEVCINRPMPGWKPRSKAAELHDKKMREQGAYAVSDDNSEGETQRNANDDSDAPGYHSDLGRVRSDSSSDDE
jgi:hypothetical protein